MERYNLKYYLEKVFNKLLDDEGTRCRVLGLNSIDFDIQIDGDSVPYIKAMRGTLVFGTKSYINKDKIYEYILTFPEYFIGNLEIDIDIGFIYNYYPLYALKYNIVSDDFIVSDDLLKLYTCDIDWSLSSEMLLEQLTNYYDSFIYNVGSNSSVLDYITVDSNLKTYKFLNFSVIDIFHNDEMRRFLCSYNLLYGSQFKHDYCLMCHYRIPCDDIISDFMNKIDGLKTLLSVESLDLDKSIIQDYVLDLQIYDFENFKTFYDLLLDLFTDFKVKSTVHIIVSHFLYSRKYEIKDYLEKNKLSNFIISDF